MKFAGIFVLVSASVMLSQPTLFSQEKNLKEKQRPQAVSGSIHSTKIEGKLAEKNKVIVADANEIQVIKGANGAKLRFNTFIVHEAGATESRLQGIKIELIELMNNEEIIHASYLDNDELGALVAGLDKMNWLLMKWSNIGKENAEASYCAKDGFVFGFTQKEATREAYAGIRDENGLKECKFQSADAINTIKTIIARGQKLLNRR